MGGSKSSSSQSSSQQDNRVGAEGEALAIGSGADVVIDQSSAFSAEVSQAFQELINFGSTALETVESSIDTIGQTSKDALQAVQATSSSSIERLAETRQLENTGQTAASINPTPIALGALALGTVYLIMKR